ncbi:MAG: hypothetical protein ACXAD7_06655 [Candidatus Kariarchaeaceae archaeon]
MTNQKYSIPNLFDLLDRIENIERQLSQSIDKAINHKTLDTLVPGKHAEEEKLEPRTDDLATDKITPVVVSSKAYLKMVLHAKKYASKSIPKKNWVEVIGLLTGHIKNENTPIEQIIVEDAWAVGSGDSVSVSIIDTKAVTDIIDKTPEGRYIVGWYHSHPSYGNFLSTDDWETQARYQALWNKSIAVVVDPTQISKHDQGYGVFRNTNNIDVKKGYTELSTKVDGLSSKASWEILKLVKPKFKGEKLNSLEYESTNNNNS